jgi:uncharacterized membrane protein YphA (DoxX/SURF4 family)
MIRIFYLVIALLLLTTAGLKALMLITDPFADVKVGVREWILWLGVAIEVSVCVAILTTRDLRVVNWLLLVLFGSFAAFSFVNWWSGKTDCGCAGNLPVPPFAFLVFNCLILGGLWWARSFMLLERPKEEWKFNSCVGGRWIGIWLVVLVFLFSRSETGKTAIAKNLSTQEVTCSDVVFKIGESSNYDDAPIPISVLVSNTANNPRRVVGVSTSCSCVFSGEFAPVSIPPNGSHTFVLKVIPKSSGKFHERVLFFVDSPQQSFVAADLVGS